ncbi:MAG: hypothetical protein ACI9G1_003928 [Pirellulaceae bacterium]|jgi:hypothetical protein
MRESPRLRRLRTDLKGMEALREESSIIDFEVPGPLHGGPPENYLVRFLGKGVWRDENSEQIHVRELHEVNIQLGASYPRMMPELQWKSPIFHPNISASGIVCLGGYGKHWVPSLNLDELCVMLWDMIRYQNYDIESPYNRDAAFWAKSHAGFTLPLDVRPLRDKVAGKAPSKTEPPITAKPVELAPAEVVFLESANGDIANGDIVDAEIIEPEDPDILFID